MLGFRRLMKDQSGAAAVEYALILALIFVALIVGVQNFGSSLGNMWGYVASEVSGA